jgi:hypothetical protein
MLSHMHNNKAAMQASHQACCPFTKLPSPSTAVMRRHKHLQRCLSPSALVLLTPSAVAEPPCAAGGTPHALQQQQQVTSLVA